MRPFAGHAASRGNSAPVTFIVKILRLHFKNINSLKGENRIDFTQAPLADAGVFAITGPNGSGKSSLLDVITLGLYGQTFRFDRPAEHVMTQHTQDCYAEVEFALGGIEYRATWSLQSADRVTTAPNMTLTRLGTHPIVLSDKIQHVRDKIAEITGLDFRRFTRSVMLAQGDFAAFLNALDSERLDILEKIVSNDVYEDYRLELQTQFNQAEQELQRLANQLAALPAPLSPAQYEALEHDLADFQDQLTEWRATQSQLQNERQWLLQLQQLAQRISELERTLQQQQTQQRDNAERLARIAASQDALPYRHDIEIIDAKTAGIARDRQTLALWHDEAQTLQKQLAQAQVTEPAVVEGLTLAGQRQNIERLRQHTAQTQQDQASETALGETLRAQLTEKEATLAHVQQWLENHAIDQRLVDDFPEIEIGRLKALRNELNGLQKNYTEAHKWEKRAGGALKKNRALLQKLQRKISALKSKLKTQQATLERLGQGYDLDAIVAWREEQKERVEAYKDLLDLAIVYQRLTKNLEAIDSQIAREKRDVHVLAQELAEFDEHLQRELNIQGVLEQAFNQEILIKRYTNDRQLLKPKLPCPLCGSLEHPFLAHPPKSGNSARALQDQQRKIKTLQVERAQRVKQLQAAEKLHHEQLEKAARLEQVRAQWHSINLRLNKGGYPLTINDYRMMKSLLKLAKSDYQSVVDLWKRYLRQQQHIHRLEMLIDRREIAAAQIQRDIESLEQNWENRPEAMVQVTVRYQECQAELQHITARITEQLAPFDLQPPAAGKEDALYDFLNIRRQDYLTHQIRMADLQRDIAQLTEQITACENNIARYTRQLGEWSQQLQSEEVVSLHLALLEKQKLIAEKEQWLAQQEQELHERISTLQTRIAVSSYPTLDALREILHDIDRRHELEDQRQALILAIQNTEQLLVQTQRQWQAEYDLALSTATVEQLDIALRELAQKIDISREEIRRCETLLQEQQQLIQQRAVWQEKIDLQQAIWQQYRDELYAAEKNSNTFRRHVQQRIADKLIALANRYLEKINGRYYLRQGESAHGLALQIEDTYQDNAYRKPKSLSGGESFVVSLALALGLAELVNNGKTLDSLFLDEGFGNLDEESLYLVVATLKELKNQGKMIGVISHVPGVQQRIPTQIAMRKAVNGYSSFELIA